MQTLNFKWDATWKEPLMRTEWRCLQKVNIELPDDPEAYSRTYNLRRQNWKERGRPICIAQQYNSQDTGVTKKSTDRLVDKEELLHAQMDSELVIK